MRNFSSFNRLVKEHMKVWESKLPKELQDALDAAEDIGPDDVQYPFVNNGPPSDPQERAEQVKFTLRFIKKARYAIMKQAPVTGLVLSGLKICVTYEVDTMAVDAKANIYINPQFLKKITPDEAVGVLVHETLHIITQTFPRQRGREMEWWNIATDYLMNNIILRDGFKLPKGALLPLMQDEKDEDGIDRKEGDVFIMSKEPGTLNDVKHVFNITGKTAEWLYAQIMKVLPPRSGNGGGGGSGERNWTPRVGEPVYNRKTGKYGKVTDIDQFNKVTVTEITKEEADELKEVSVDISK